MNISKKLIDSIDPSQHDRLLVRRTKIFDIFSDTQLSLPTAQDLFLFIGNIMSEVGPDAKVDIIKPHLSAYGTRYGYLIRMQYDSSETDAEVKYRVAKEIVMARGLTVERLKTKIEEVKNTKGTLVAQLKALAAQQKEMETDLSTRLEEAAKLNISEAELSGSVAPEERVDA